MAQVAIDANIINKRKKFMWGASFGGTIKPLDIKTLVGAKLKMVTVEENLLEEDLEV